MTHVLLATLRVRAQVPDMRWLVAVLCVSCGPLGPPQGDAGSSGGGTANTGGGWGGGAGGGSTGGGGGGGGGTSSGDGGTAFTFARLSFDPVPALSSSPYVVGLTRRSNGELWVALENGSIFRGTGDTLQALPGVPPRLTSNELIDLVSTGDELILLRSGDVLRCTGTCAQFSDFTSLQVFSGIEHGQSLCTRGDRVFALTLSNAVTALREFDRPTSKFVTRSGDLDLDLEYGANCFVSEQGDVFVVGSGAKVVVRAAGGALHTENVVGNVSVGIRYFSVHVSDAGGFAVGMDNGLAVAVREGTQWRALADDSSGMVFSTVLVAGTDVLAAGFTDASSSVWRWQGQRFAPVTPAPFAINASMGLVVSPREIYLGGAGRSGGAYEVLRGTR